MLRNRLAELLAERNLKITRVANDIDELSRNTINSIANNKTKMMQIDTINLLCQYLGINVSDFFEFKPFDLETKIFDVDFDYPARLNENLVKSNKSDDLFFLKNFSIEGVVKVKSIKEDFSSIRSFNITVLPTIKYIPFVEESDDDKHEISADIESPSVTELIKNYKIFNVKFVVLIGKDDEKFKSSDEFKKVWLELGPSFQADFKNAMQEELTNKYFTFIDKFFFEKISSVQTSVQFNFLFDDIKSFKQIDNHEDINTKFF